MVICKDLEIWDSREGSTRRSESPGLQKQREKKGGKMGSAQVERARF